VKAYIQDHIELCRMLNYFLAGMSIETVQREMKKSDSALRYMRALFSRYNRAQRNAGNFSLIGVGAISFAQVRLQKFQERVAWRAAKRRVA